MTSSNPPVARDVLSAEHPLCRVLDLIDLVTRQAAACVAFLVGVTAAAYPDVTRPGTLAITDVLVTLALVLLLVALRQERHRRARLVIIQRGAADLAELRTAQQRLADSTRRGRLADTLTQALASAINWHQQPVATRPPPSIRHLAAHTDVVRTITAALRDERADIRAVAMVEELLDGGYSAPLYQHDPITLGEHLRRITYTFATSR